MAKIKVYTITYDHDGGLGCEVYPTEAERDARYREGLESFGIDPDMSDEDIDQAQGECDVRYILETWEIEVA
jgi:hypothetical protein